MKKNPSRITKELLETAKGMHKVGILDDKAYEKITKRHIGKAQLLEMEPITLNQPHLKGLSGKVLTVSNSEGIY